MKFGTVSIDQAAGAVLAHSLTAGERRFRKAHLLNADDIAFLKATGIRELVVARLDPGDVSEDKAAERIARALMVRNVEVKAAATGRVNLHAETAGVFIVDKALVDAINAVDPAITLATVPDYAEVQAGQMVATVKIIPFAVAGELVDQVVALCAGREAFAIKPFRALRVGMIQTVLPGIKGSVLDKTSAITVERLARSQSEITEERRTPHEAAPVAEAVEALVRDNDMVLVFGASAMCDFEDVIPAAIMKAGGRVIRAGMPVDPGNLLVIGEIGGKPVIGAPGCARSPKENGFDWVLDRVIAGLPVSAMDIAGMGVGGLLMEIPTRPQPREARERPVSAKVGVVVLAAGRSSRMGGPNKLMALFGDRPLIRLTVERALASNAATTVVVTGHQADRIEAALSGLAVKFVHNPDFATGLASSLKAGIAALPPDITGALIVLGDMPGITADDLNRMITAFKSGGGRPVVRATHEGRRGNPVLLPRSLFPAVAGLQGDTGARHIVEAEGANAVDVEIGAGAALDVDTRDALESAGGVLQER
ncbi:molybdenum cofactor cytidylyltransferase [Mesorhizobium soli]|uniref:molybdopterin-binding/glycosyltransferase family 2 protein n=1 Tax=Pseudaminobacter soli (ex Li et al. 2025) TaxID=1295366 RepID=UPI0024748008|nr:molybdopterin-binding/glycosyltransferase family 2 protein [Mesorhizobium soli]MDH6229642.1 molybdenum cofactor cytidylyltransferase [Mesorhizobium soli]